MSRIYASIESLDGEKKRTVRLGADKELKIKVFVGNEKENKLIFEKTFQDRKPQIKKFKVLGRVQKPS